MLSPDSRRALPWEALLLASVAIAALVFQAVLPGKLAAVNDEKAAVARIVSQMRPGDVVLLHPWWTERARQWIPDSLPVVGYLGSDGDPLSNFQRIWLLDQPALPVAQEQAFHHAFLPNRSRQGEPERFGKLELNLYENGLYEPVRFRASEALAQARVAIEADGQQIPCTWTQMGWSCSGQVHVATGWHELFYAPHHCIALEPPGGTGRVTLTFWAVPSTKALVLEAGILWEHAWKHDPGMSALHVKLTSLKAPGMDPVFAELVIPPGQEGMQQMRIPGHAGPLEISVESSNRKERASCIDLRAVDYPAVAGVAP